MPSLEFHCLGTRNKEFFFSGISESLAKNVFPICMAWQGILKSLTFIFFVSFPRRLKLTGHVLHMLQRLCFEFGEVLEDIQKKMYKM